MPCSTCYRAPWSARQRPKNCPGSTFTVNNIGALGHLMGDIDHPLRHDRPSSRLAARSKNPWFVTCARSKLRPILEVTLSFDHRAIDGGLAQRFMARIRENLEEPVKALL